MAEKTRFALVIGNSHYGDGKPVSGVEDARAMVACLEELEFEVPEPLLDANLKKMTKALEAFEERIRTSEATVVLFYYAGHGFHLGRQNFLLPTDGDIASDLSIPVDDVLQVLGSASNALKFAFLDACRDEKEGDHRGLVEPGPAPPRLLQSFATSPGQLAASGSDDQLSLYTMALLRHLREPGLELVELFDRVRADVLRDSSFRKQHPIVAGAIPTDFFFRPPVFVQAKIHRWPHSPLLVFHESRLALSTDQEEPLPPLRLKAEDNELVLMVSNGKNFHNGQVWGRTQSWSYKLDLTIPDKDLPEGRTVTFEGREDVPFKDGPHHGQTFVVAEANLFVHPRTAEVTVKDPKTDLAHRGTPFWAQDQEVLFKEKLVNLQISASDVLGGVVDFDLAPLFEPFLDEFLKTGKILDRQVVDAEKSFVAVRGNERLREVARHCMTEEWPDRLQDLRASFAAFFNFRHPRPFDLFADGLDASIRANASRFPELAGLAPGDLRVWTSLDDFGPEAPAVDASPAGIVAARELAAAARAASTREALEAVQDSILLPRQNEVLIETRSIEQVVQGVPLTAPIHIFLSLHPAGSRIRVQARVVGDLSDLQNKIGPLIDTIPLPTDNCSHFGIDNFVAKIWGKQITVGNNGATLKLNGDVEVWTCVKNPIPCSRLEWEERNVFGATIRIPRTVFFDCNPPIKNRNATQPFEAALPFSVEVVTPQSYGLKLGQPSIDLGGPLGGVTEGILKIAGVDINAEAKKALDRAINPGSLTQTLPDFLIPYNPALTKAELLSNSGALALTLEAEAILTLAQLGQLIQTLRNRR